MGNVIELYINFSGNESFLKQIIDDERSFSIPLFERTARKLSNHNIITQDKLERFTQVMVKLEQMQSKKKRFQQAMSTIPEEFLDPILGELIRDPVMLPSSKVQVYIKTICRSYWIELQLKSTYLTIKQTPSIGSLSQRIFLQKCQI